MFCVRRAAARLASPWAQVQLGPPDPILGLTLAFQKDTDPSKVNLGVGAYRDENGKPFVLQCVKKAKEALHQQDLDHEYAPIAGVPAFVPEAQKLLFSAASASLADKRVGTVQTISGTGALRVAGDFLNRFYPGEKTIYLPTPTWANHVPVFEDAGLAVKSYRYYLKDTCGLNLSGLLEDINAAPDNSIILLHACAHNPTGVDPTAEEWQQILAAMKNKGHFAFMDSAYQGFATGNIDDDAYAVRLFADSGIPMLACQSFAKNFGLYGERCGALHFVCSSAEECENVMSQLKILVRPMYSNPPINGARIVAAVLSNPELFSLWQQDVKLMADRIVGMRHTLVDKLTAAGSTKDWSHITKQIGMFSFTGLNTDQCKSMVNDHHVYMTANGRISVAGLTGKNVDHVAQAMHAVSKA